MQKSKSKYKNEEQPLKTFKMFDAWWYVVLSVLLMGMFVFLFQGQLQEAMTDGDPALIGMAVLLGVIYALLMLYWLMTLTTKIEIYEHGIALRYGSTLVYSTWENTAYIERRPRGKSSVTGIVTLQDVDQQTTGTWFERMLHHKADMRFIDLSPISIPSVSTGMFSERVVDTYRLSTTEFGKYLEEYAPHLLGKERLS